MTEPDADEVNMNGDAIHLLHSIMENALINKEFALVLKKNWETSNLISEEDFFENVYGNKPLMKTMTKHLANALSDDATRSHFGLELVSDHELYFQGKTDKMLNQLLSSKGISLMHNKFIELRKKRTLLYKFVKDTRDQTLINMDFIGRVHLIFHYL
jgi:hypothetical protein